MRLRGTADALRVSVGPEGFSCGVGAGDTPIWKTAVIQPSGREDLSRVPTTNASVVRRMMSGGAFQVALLGLAEDGTLLGTIQEFAPINLEVFAIEAKAGANGFNAGGDFIPGSQFLPGDQYLPGVELVRR
jgi:hypothetical protein